MTVSPTDISYARTMPGVVIGIVERTTGDPEKLGRIKVRFPWLGGTILSNWCRVASFFAGKGVGAYFFPARGDEVLVAFDSGNINVPYVIGALWNGVDAPPVQGEKEQQNVRKIKTRGGSVILIDDTAGKEKIEITDKAGDRITIDVAKKNIELSAGGNITLSAPKGKLTIDASEVSITAKGKAQITSGEMNLSGKKGVTVKGARIKLN